MKKRITLLAAGMIATAAIAHEATDNHSHDSKEVTLEEAAQPKAETKVAKSDTKKETKAAKATPAKAKEEPKVAAKAEPKPLKVDLSKVVISTEKDKFSYAAGLDMGNSILQFKDALSLQAFFAGFEAVIAERTPKITPEEGRVAIESTIDGFRKKEQAKADSLNIANKVAGEKFLEENKKRPEVKTTASGLQYEILKDSTGFELVGVGDSPAAEDEITVHYKGTTIDGKEFDSSYKRGEPATFGVNRVIPGWIEGLQLMKTGGHFKFYIPSNLAYGEQGAGRDIPPHSALIFEVELLGLSKTVTAETVVEPTKVAEPAKPATAAKKK